MRYYDGKTPNKALIAKLLAQYNDKSGLTAFDKQWLKSCDRINVKAACAAAQGPAKYCETKTARNAYIRRKGGVIPGTKVFI